MNISKVWLLVIAIPLLIVIIIGGSWLMIKGNKEQEFKDSFAKTQIVLNIGHHTK